MKNDSWRKITITFELDRPFTDDEKKKALDAAVSAVRNAMGAVDGNMIRWTSVSMPANEDWIVPE